MLSRRLRSVDAERVELDAASGRVLREDLLSDRPSPPVSVSAMDGFAVRLTDLGQASIPLQGEVQIGSAPHTLGQGVAMRITTGGAIPEGADAVIRREDVEEGTDAITIDPGVIRTIRSGNFIRHEGENIGAGAHVAWGGSRITPAIAGALATFGCARPLVSRRVRIAYLSTGDELVEVDEPVEPWNIRDSSGPALRTLLAVKTWRELVSCSHVHDDPQLLCDAIVEALSQCDMLITTGGVSMGDRDFVPAALEQAGATIIFHKVAQRPGKPLLGAIGPKGQAILSLPGNPVSVLVALLRIVGPVCEHLAGMRTMTLGAGGVTLTNPSSENSDLWNYPLVRLESPGLASLVETRGSGDIVSAAHSDGFVEIPPGQSGPGPWLLFPWNT